MARAAQEAGFSVTLVTGSERCREGIEAQGIRVILCPFLTPGGMSLWREARAAAALIGLYRAERPHLAHHITIKSILYGSLAARAARTPHVINAFAGLGYIFVSEAPLARALRVLLFPILGLLMRREGFVTLFQNPDDRQTLRDLGLVGQGEGAGAEKTIVIPGSGVDPDALPALPLPPVEVGSAGGAGGAGVVCVYAGRMIGIKGLETLREAFALLDQQARGRGGVAVTLWLCGAPDPANPGSWSREDLRRWEREAPNVRWLDQQPDMAAIWARAHIALQPSYGGEGIPRALLEAACCARPIIASDVPGCREVVDPGKSGLLVPPRDAEALAGAIESLARDPQRMRVFGVLGRRLIEERGLSVAAVMDQTRKMYESMA